MKLFRVRLFLCCVLAIFLNGCNSTDPCGGTCDPDEVCVNSFCRITCDDDEEDDECPPRQFCVDRVCFDSCNTSDDCECDSDADCDDQDACTTDTCVGDNCTNAPICDLDEVCIDGVCVDCATDADCNAGVCDEAANTCVECLVDADCDDQSFCTLETCDFGPICSRAFFACTLSEDCPAGCNAACTQGICTD